MSDVPNIDIRPDHWQIVQQILQKQLPNFEVWAFGSRAKWTAKDYSDLDLAVISSTPLSLAVSAALSDDFAESDLPYKVDIVDWASTSDSFRRIIERDKVVVQRVGGNNNVCLPITYIVDFNPQRQIKRGVLAPFVDMAALQEHQRDVSYFAERQFTGGGSRFKNGDTLFARITPCLENGKTAKVNCLPNDAVAHGSTEFIVMAPKMASYDEDYVYYLARHPEFRAFAEARMEGTSGRQRVSWQALSEFTFPFPQPEKRKVIGSVLRDLDDKIDLNRRINQNLEAMAQAIFKSWFIDFDPVKAKVAAKAAGLDPLRAAMAAISGKSATELDSLPAEDFQQLAATAALFPDAMQDSEWGEIPKGWSMRVMSDCIDVNPSRTLRKGVLAQYLDMANVPTNSARVHNVVLRKFSSGSKFRNGDTLLARITPCLENGKTAFVDFLDSEEVGWGSTEFIVLRPKDELPELFAYFLCRRPDFRAFAIAKMAGTSGRQRVPNDCFNNYTLVLPKAEVAFEFGRIANLVLNQIKALDLEAKTLSSLRDTLLPKLLSAELPVTSIADAAGTA